VRPELADGGARGPGDDELEVVGTGMWRSPQACWSRVARRGRRQRLRGERGSEWIRPSDQRACDGDKEGKKRTNKKRYINEKEK
jgi:hypothetical protein